MNWVAWKMLTGDRAKYLGTVFGVAFGGAALRQVNPCTSHNAAAMIKP